MQDFTPFLSSHFYFKTIIFANCFNFTFFIQILENIAYEVKVDCDFFCRTTVFYQNVCSSMNENIQLKDNICLIKFSFLS